MSPVVRIRGLTIILKLQIVIIEPLGVIPHIYGGFSIRWAGRTITGGPQCIFSPSSVPVRNHGVVENPQPCRVCNLFAHAESFNKTQTRNSHQLRLSPNTIHEPRDTLHEQRVTIHRLAFLLWKPNFGFGLSSSAAIAESISNTA